MHHLQWHMANTLFACVMQEVDAAHRETLALAEEQATEAAKALQEERSQRKRMIEAAAAGQISVQALSEALLAACIDVT